MLSLKTKYWFYEKANKLVCMIFRDDVYIRNVVKKPRNITERNTEINLDDDIGAENYLKLTRDERDQQENCVWIVTLWISSFFSLLFNFIYVHFLQEFMQNTVGMVITTTDRLGFDMHILRNLYLALFDNRIQKGIYSSSMFRDLLLLTIIVIPLFVLGLKFWTAPIYSAYASKSNSIVAPLAMFPIFASKHIDLTMMGIIVLLMNAYVFWYHTDPPEDFLPNRNRYSKYRTKSSFNKRNDDSSDDDRRFTSKIDYSSVKDFGLKALSVGVPVPHMFAN